MTYTLSFTTGSLFVYESEMVVDLFLECKDWEMVRKEVVENNLLQKGTISTRKREFHEIKKRLQTLNDKQLSFFKEANSSDMKYLALLSCYKTYKFIYDFVSEVIRDKILLFDYHLLDSDYERFYESKSLLYDNLNTITQNTRYKIKQVMFKMLEQAKIIDSAKNKNIQKPYLSKELIELIVQDDPRYLKGFLYSDADIKEFTKEVK